MDLELRAAERAFAEGPSTERLRALLCALVRAGRSKEIPAWVVTHVGDAWHALGARQLVVLRGLEGRSGPIDGLTEADFVVDVLGWQLPPNMGAHVFVEARRARASLIHLVSPESVFDVTRTTVLGSVWCGTEVALRLRLPGEVVEVARLLIEDREPGDDDAQRAVDDLRRLAVAAGAVYEERDEAAFWD